jgi:ribosomal protein L11 methyltransferase
MAKAFIQVTFTDVTTEKQEVLIAYLSEAGYEGFEESVAMLNAFIPADIFDQSFLIELAAENKVTYTTSSIDAQNWNAVWESNFQPVVVDDFVVIRAHFHEPAKGGEHEIIITPKMSFGTGHHATTFMMMQEMRKIDFNGKNVLDFGTGTGVLAILAQKLGAKKIIAIDHDEWSIENATENMERNDCELVEVVKLDTAVTGQVFDIILANINKNVILDNMKVLSEQLSKGGILLLSGLLKEDEPDIRKAAEEHLLVFAGRAEKDNWLCLKMIYY